MELLQVGGFSSLSVGDGKVGRQGVEVVVSWTRVRESVRDVWALMGVEGGA
jgi:hypothetical protein